MNIQDAIDVIESVSGFTDESTPVGEAWLEVLSFIHRPAALATPPPEPPTDEDIKRFAEVFELFDEIVLIRAALERWGK